MPSPFKYVFSKLKNAIMGYTCLKFVESNEWEKALNVYKSNPQLNLTVTNKDGPSLIEILLQAPEIPLILSEQKFKDEILKGIISSLDGPIDKKLFRHHLDSTFYKFKKLNLHASTLIHSIFHKFPHLAPNLFEKLTSFPNPNKQTFLDYMLTKSFIFNNEALMLLAINYYKAEPSLAFPTSILTFYFNLLHHTAALPVITLEDFCQHFKDKKIDHEAFVSMGEFNFTKEFFSEHLEIVEDSRLIEITQNLTSYYKCLKSLGFNPTLLDNINEDEPINLLERCFLHDQFLSVLALCTVYPEIFCQPSTLSRLNYWVNARSVDPDCSLLPGLSSPKYFSGKCSPHAFNFAKQELEIMFQKIELEKELDLPPTKSNINSYNYNNPTQKTLKI